MNDNPLPILYTARRCPYSTRTRMVLGYAQITVEIREVELGSQLAELLACSPTGKTPVLHLPDGRIVDESLDIMRWALSQNDPDGWSTTQAALTAELILACDTSFKKNLDLYKYHNESSKHPREHYQQLAAEFLRHLERCLVKNDGRGLVRGTIALADVAISPFVRQFAGADQKWFDAAPYPAIHNWLNVHIRSPLFALAMKKYPVWNATKSRLIERWPPLKPVADIEFVRVE